VDALSYRTTFGYDLAGQNLYRKDARNNYITFAYDLAGRTTTITNELNQASRQYKYNAAGWLSGESDPSGGVATYVYDNVGRRTSADLSTSGSRYTYAYDKLGQRTTLQYVTGTQTFVYDAKGQLKGTTDSGGAVLSYVYDSVGNRTVMELVGTGRFTYAYDADNRMATMMTPGAKVYTSLYDADSRRTTLVMGLGITRKYSYDNASRLNTLLYLNGATPIATFVDTYDNVGNRTGETRDGVATVWSYDDEYRLLGQQRTGSYATFTYDANDNLLTKWQQGTNPISLTYNAANRPVTYLQGADLTTLTWAQRGILSTSKTGSPITTYLYEDITNRLFYVQPTGGTNSSYTYNGDGLRLQTKEGTTTSTMVWDGSDYAQVKRSTGTNSLFVVIDGEVVGEDVGGTLRDFIVDPLGSVVGHLNSSGAITNSFEFWPYGESSGGTRASGTFQWVGSHGYYADPGTRTYIRAREYEQSIGSWLQLDLLWPNEQGYGYVNGMAVSAVDPSGTVNRQRRFWECMHKWRAKYPTFSERERCQACRRIAYASVDCDSDCFNTQPSTPMPGLPGLPKPIEDCLLKCIERGGDVAECLKKCGLDKLKGYGAELVYCILYPEACKTYGYTPCRNVRDNDSCQACADQKHIQCMLTKPPLRWGECEKQHTGDYMECARKYL
jgi:YD repeat-containing protein